MHSKIVPDFHCVDFSDLKLPMITVYDHPTDFPEHYVARIWTLAPDAAGQSIGVPTNVIMIAATLTELRNGIPSWFTHWERYPWDDPTIAEVWI